VPLSELLADLWPVLPATAAAVLVAQLITFGVGLRLGRLSVVDVTWGAGFALIAVVGWSVSMGDGDPLRRRLLVVLTVLWGMRLALHIGWRQRGGVGEDPRYTQLMAARTGHPKWAALRSVFLMQAAAGWLISLPVQVGMVAPDRSVALSAVMWGGVLCWAVGFGFEAVGDYQLERFKASPGSRGQVMDSGLWRYTRHPNYFGDACVWWGLFLIALDPPWGFCTLPAPLLMTWLLTAKTGKPMLEAQLTERRPGYADYVRRTSGFLPRPPRKQAK
jgi:steroid 5-alpha reductase family enzyme